MRWALSVLTALTATNVAAEPVPLDGQALTAMISGASIRLDTPLGTTIPVHYGDNGHVWGEAGSVAFALGAPADRGRWWVDANRLCHRWTVWFERETQCLRLRQDGTRLLWVRDDGKTGTATLVPRPPSQPAEPVQHVQTASLTPVGPPHQPSAETARPAPTVGRTTPIAANQPTLKPVSAPATVVTLKPVPRTKDDAPLFPKASAASAPVRAAPERATASGNVVPPPQSPASPAITPTYKVAFVDDDDVLNVRSGPAMAYASIGAIPPGAQGVKVTGVCEQDWCPIVHRNITGWVNRYYLEIEPFISAQPFMHISSAAPR